MFLNDSAQPIIDFSGQAVGCIYFEGLNARLDVREHLHVDARSVHATDSLGANIVKRPLTSSNLTYDAGNSSCILGCRKTSSRAIMRATDFSPFLFIIVCLRKKPARGV